jgi:hypothetical protein
MKSKFNLNFVKSKFLSSKAVDTKTVFSLSNSKEFDKLFHKYLRFIVVFSSGITRVTPRLRHFHKLLILILKTYKNHGSLYTIKWLKSCHIAIQKHLAGQPFKTLRTIEPELPLPRLINGLPYFIGTVDRRLIREGHTPTIRLWLSILSIYRIIEGPTKAKIDTIINPFAGDQMELDALKHCTFTLIDRLKVDADSPLFGLSVRSLKIKGLRNSTHAGPNINIANNGVLSDMVAILRIPGMYDKLLAWCDITSSPQFKSLIVQTADVVKEAIRITNTYNLETFAIKDPVLRSKKDKVKTNGRWKSTIRFFHVFLTTTLIPRPKVIEEYTVVKEGGSKPVFKSGTWTDFFAGRLVGLPEAAGKLRIIAIVDIWTQSIFSPLHKTLFSVLRKIPNDGTFDQDKAFLRAMDKTKASGKVFSADLSAATDRLPIDLQIGIINYLFGHQLGNLWGAILDREFVTREGLGPIPFGGSVKYGCGQPMGCLSSWAMLALTHHLILQYCATNVHGQDRWHTCYEILGDDLIIFDEQVYYEYLRVMSLLAVEINPAKSLESFSSQTFEFAKRTSYKGVDVSGISWLLFISTTSIKDRINLILSLGIKGIIWREGLLARLLLFSTHSIKDKLLTEDSVQGVMLSLLSHFASKGLMSYEDAICYVLDPSKEGGNLSLDNYKIPVRTALHDLVELIDHKRLSLVNGEPFMKEVLSISKLSFRHLLGESSTFANVKHSIFTDVLSRVFSFEQDYESLPRKLAIEICGSSSFYTLNQIESIIGQLDHDMTYKVDLDCFDSFLRRYRPLVSDLAHNLLYGFGDDQGIFAVLGNGILGYENATQLSTMIQFKDRIEALINKFKFAKTISRKSVEKPQWLLSEVMRVFIPEHSAYWKAIHETAKIKFTNSVSKVPMLDRLVPPIHLLEDAYMPPAEDYAFWSKVAKYFVPMDKGKKAHHMRPLPPRK